MRHIVRFFLCSVSLPYPFTPFSAGSRAHTISTRAVLIGVVSGAQYVSVHEDTDLRNLEIQGVVGGGGARHHHLHAQTVTL